MNMEEMKQFGWEVKEGYEHYEMTVIEVNERKGVKALQGMNANWELESIAVVPLNGYRARNLAEQILGERDAGLWTLGTAKLVRAEDLLNLPDWDGRNEDYLKTFTGVVSIEVIAVDPGYGKYIRVEQNATAGSVRA